MYTTENTTVNRAAVLHSTSSPLQVQIYPIPVPGPDQVLIRTKAVAINPSDWKMQDSKKSIQLPCILGSDVAGFIEAVGCNVNKDSLRFQKGDRIAAFAGGAWSGILEEGALQEFVLVSANSAVQIPEIVTFEQASTFPMAIATAASALWHTLKIPRPSLSKEHKSTITLSDVPRSGILVYGASSSVGLMTVQLASRMGYQVFAVASSRNEAYVRSVGAHHFIDRQGVDIVKRLKQTISNANLTEPLRLGFDAISSKETLKLALQCLDVCPQSTMESARRRKAKLAITLNWPDDLELPELVDIERVSASHFHVKEDNARWLFNEYLKSHLQNGTIVAAPPVRVVEGGISSASASLDICRKGVSCEKLVVQLGA